MAMMWTVEQVKENRNLIERLISGEWDDEERLLAERTALKARYGRYAVCNNQPDLQANGWELEDCRKHIKSLYASLELISTREHEMIAAGVNPYR